MGEIYVKLLDEGTEVYRAVPATQLESSVYLIDPRAPYNTDDETWEFSPGSRVVVIKRVLNGETKLVASHLKLSSSSESTSSIPVEKGVSQFSTHVFQRARALGHCGPGGPHSGQAWRRHPGSQSRRH